MSKQVLFTSFRDFTVIFRILFFDRFWRFKKGFRVIFLRSLRKSDLKTCIAALNHEIFMFDLFHPVTWDDLDLYYGHKAQEMILADVSDTIHADSLAVFALNIEILLADVTKPEKSKILTLTWPVTSSVTSRSNFLPCTGSSRTGLSNGVWNLEIGPVVWEISGGPFAPPPPPQQDVLLTRVKFDTGTIKHIFPFDEIWTRKKPTTIGLQPRTTLFEMETECEYIHSKGNCPLFRMAYLAKSYTPSVVSYLSWKLGVTFF